MTGQLKCDGARIELPVVTHYSRATDGFEFLAADPPELIAPSTVRPAPGEPSHFYLHGFLPDYGSYLADVYSDRAVPDDVATEFFRSLREECGVPFDFLRPDAFVSREDGPGRLFSNSGSVQVVHAKIIDGSLATIILPPDWRFEGPTGRYPIVFNGFYDLNQNLFELEGRRWLKAIAWSGTEGRTGAIGVLWNGGGALASRSIGEHAFRQFSSVIDYVAANLGGDRHRLFTSGASRGGLTAIGMACNPFGHDYTVLFSAPTATPTKLGEHAILMSTTYPAMLHAAAWSTGFADAWRTGWTYPDCAGRPGLTGVSAAQAHAYVLTGETDLAKVSEDLSPLSDRFVRGLRQAGTQIYLEATAFDNIVMYSHQMEYAQRLLREGFPVHVDVLIRAGHNERLEDGILGRRPVRFNRMLDALRPHVGAEPAPAPPVGMSWYALDRATGDFEPFTPDDGLHPFSMESPYVQAAGTRAPIVLVGHPGTEFSVGLADDRGQEVRRITGTIPEASTRVEWLDLPVGFRPGSYTYSLQIRKPGRDWVTIPETNTTTGQVAVLRVADEEPNVHAAEAAQWAAAPMIGQGGTNWGLSEY